MKTDTCINTHLRGARAHQWGECLPCCLNPVSGSNRPTEQAIEAEKLCGFLLHGRWAYPHTRAVWLYSRWLLGRLAGEKGVTVVELKSVESPFSRLLEGAERTGSGHVTGVELAFEPVCLLAAACRFDNAEQSPMLHCLRWDLLL
jgi:hypothetical protein